MVAVRMVSEGVDIPRLAVGVFATSVSTALFFAQAVGRFVRARRREDGGFVEIAQMRRSGTNPTAAAVGVLQILNALGEDVKPGVRGLLARLQSSEGGLLANSRVPLADLLSTFTGLWTLEQLGASERIDKDGVRRFVAGLADPDGGFRAGLWDERTDVEYTFYGLGALALAVSRETASGQP